VSTQREAGLPLGRAGGGVSIRPARREDVGAIASLAGQFAEYMRELGDTSSVQLNAAALERDGFGADPAFQGLVAEVAGDVVGYLLHHSGYDTDQACRLLFVVDLYVARPARSKGVGAALMEEARLVAAKAAARQIVWTVDRRNKGALRFYMGLGAVHVDELALMCIDV